MAAMLVACGGGGGGDGVPAAGGGTGGGTVNSPATGGSTGLVPVAPAAGQVLVSDSAPLRPLSVGLSWQYRQFTPFIGPSRTRVTMLAGTAGRVIERSSDTSLADTELFRNAEGQTIGSISVPLGAGRSLTISGVELPRELRAGQQFTVYDARTDGIDIAFWRVVAGFEDVLVPASPNPVRALRVDDRATLRNGTQTTQLYASTWYAPDIGVVRSVEWTDATRTATESDDRLVGFDGGGRGFGAVTTSAVGTLSARAVLEDGYVTLNNTETIVADRSGKQVASGSIVRAPEEPYAARLLPTSAGLRVATLARFSVTDRFNLDALDANGRLLGARLGTLPVQSGDGFILSTPSFVTLASHRASPVIWMSYIEAIDQGNGLTIRYLVVQRFDANGQPLGARLQWALPTGTFGGTPQVEALPDELVLVLREGGVQEPERVRVRTLGNDGTVRNDRAYQVSDRSVPMVRLIVDGAARWLAWRADDGLARAWRLGADGAPVGVPETLASAQAALVPLPPRLREQWPFGVVAAGGRWTIPGSDFASLTGDPRTPATGHAVLALFDPGAGDVRNQPAPALIRLEASELVGSLAIPFGDRTLWPVTSSADERDTAVIQWR
ncbi:hypothetical protein [Rubrivivax rivuli]|uniref:hypothetical protein n=1 Tax=Rubrivivax rivuli TaxID=1862385 RepID=UPI00196ACEC5|nr:hypothetical protein [Rubrivivax rivuli]